MSDSVIHDVPEVNKNEKHKHKKHKHHKHHHRHRDKHEPHSDHHHKHRDKHEPNSDHRGRSERHSGHRKSRDGTRDGRDDNISKRKHESDDESSKQKSSSESRRHERCHKKTKYELEKNSKSKVENFLPGGENENHAKNFGRTASRDELGLNRGHDNHQENRLEDNKPDEDPTSIDSSSSESEPELEDVDWYEHKSVLDRIFFKENDLIKKGSPAYNDFWSFLDKYVAFERRKAMQSTGRKSKGKGDSRLLSLPLRYDKRYRINVTMVTRDVDSVLQRQSSRKEKDCLTSDDVTRFRSILLHYIDFSQKQKFVKLTKIRRDQRNLPIFQYKDDILRTLEQHQVVVVAGDTGCGKSTQVPQYLLEAGYTKIACTQPRRIACISLSKRVAFETLNEYGSQVAFQVRFEKSKTQATRILFLTEGLLLRQITTDSILSQYSVLIVDEVHERHLHTDCLLGVLRCLIQHRSDLKIVLMSATINIKLFSGFFDDAPVVKVPGRLYPIQLEYCPISQADKEERSSRLDPTPYLRIMQRIDKKYPSTERGDLLIFLSGMSEIMAVVEAAKMYAQTTKCWIVLPLHSALSVDEQEKVFDISPDGVRKCIVSTNIAETSVTIDGVRFIVDSGKVKEMSYDSKYKMQKLQEFWISRASAEQRKGRAGRTGPGVCFRLYGEPDYDAFQEYATPEILRVPLDSLVLQMASMGLPDARKFPFIEPPSRDSLETSIGFLKDQGALTDEETLTPIGQMLSQLPVDVVMGKMLIMGSIFHMIDPVLSVAAALSVQSPFTSRAHTDHDAMSARKSLESEHGDPFTLLNAFDEWIQVKAEGRGTKKWCRRRGFEEQRFYEMTKLKKQFKDLLKDHNLLHVTADEPERLLTSEQRRQRHGERKKLRELKRTQNNLSRKRKVLKFENEVIEHDNSSDDEAEADIKDLEFRLSHNMEKEQEKSNQSRCFTLRDINLLKVIFSSGLYPQVAIPDDCNSFKADSEQAFHTKNKGFILLHPTSIFASQPDLLHLNDLDLDKRVSGTKTEVYSHKHELLSFVTLLETTKPYLTGTMRIPALQTLLLHAHHIDTNSAATRVVCDGWLELKFDDPEDGEDILVSAVQLRNTWQTLLKLRLDDSFKKLNEDGLPVINAKARKLERTLANKLSEFLASKVKYTLRRVFTAELQHLYIGPSQDCSSDNEVIGDLMKLASKGTEHPIKGGTQVNDYLTCGCLHDEGVASVYGEYTMYMQRHWTCPRCGQTLVVTVTERLQHETECAEKASTEGAADLPSTEDQGSSELDPLRRPFHCTSCNQHFRFTTAEILKHCKSCKKQSESTS